MSSKGWDDGTIDYQADRIEELEAINAEMLAALELVAKCSMYPGVAVKRVWSDTVFAAIAKAKGELP